MGRIKKKVTKQTFEKAIELYQNGLTAQAVGDMLGLSASTVLGYVKKRGIPVRGKSKKEEPKVLETTVKEEEQPKQENQVSRVISLKTRGYSNLAIAELMGISEYRVIKALNTTSKMDCRYIVSPRDKESIADLYASGKCAYDIGLKYGISADSVMTIAKEFGVYAKKKYYV